MSEFICPFCFKKIDTNVVMFQCINSSCTWDDWKRTAFLRGMELEQMNESWVEKHPTVFEVKSPNHLSRLFGMKNSGSGVCPNCSVLSTIRVCPECHSPLPHGINELSNMIIAVVGAKETGKSHYIAVLIQRIRQLYKSFNWTLSAMDDETIDLYKRHFYNPLFIAKRTLLITQSARANTIVKKPLLYSLCMTNGRKCQTVTLAFFDTAGEDMDDEQQMGTINRYIYNASGIILLLDPLQLPKVRVQMTTNNLPQAENTYGGEIINRIANLIHRGREIPRDRSIPIPLAVTFSKIDMMRNILGGDFPVFQKSRHRTQFNLREYHDIDGRIKDWITDLDSSQSDIVQQTGKFNNVGFFGVSSLGGNPSVDGHLAFEPRPIRVEDPFLWILWKTGLIQGDRS